MFGVYKILSAVEKEGEAVVVVVFVVFVIADDASP